MKSLGAIFGNRRGKVLDVDKFRGLTPQDRSAMDHFSRSVEKNEKVLKKQISAQRRDKIKGDLKSVKARLPKGICMPDDLVRNHELYGIKRSPNKKKVRLF
jgi:hypothetical protein